MTTSTLSFTVRAPSRADVPAILALIAATDIAESGEAESWTEADLTSEWNNAELGKDVWLVEGVNGACIGYGELNNYGKGLFRGDLYEVPSLRGKGILTELTNRMLARVHERAGEAPEGSRVVVQIGTYASDTSAHQTFMQAGFYEIRHHYQMRITMTEPPAAPVWPTGVMLRPFVAEHDIRPAFELMDKAFEDHWGHVPMPYDVWAARLGRDDRDLTLLFVAWTGETLAGAALCRMMGELGWVGSLGVDRAWRGQGLGRALLLHAFGEFWRRGVRTVGLGVDAQNLTGALRLYEKAGMSPAKHFTTWEREIRAGKDLVVRELGK